MPHRTKIAIIGAQGVPAQYGGFETMIDHMLDCCDMSTYAITVFCSSFDYAERIQDYKGANIQYAPFHANGAQSIAYDAICLYKVLRGFDVVLMLGASGALALPLFKMLSKTKVIINMDGVESRRDKWSPAVKAIWRHAERVACKYGDLLVSDNVGIQQFIEKEYGAQSECIAYGGDHAVRDLDKASQLEILQKYNLKPQEYFISVCRIEPENNCHVTLEAFTKTDKQLVFIGNWGKSDYGKELKATYKDVENILILDPIYDLDYLYSFRNNCTAYIHGHSVGGTNPTLVEAMNLGCNIIAFDVIFNRQTTFDAAVYFGSADELVELVDKEDINVGDKMLELATKEYSWKRIAQKYEELYQRVLN